MKLHQINKYKLMALALPAITLLSTGCTKEFLEPEPLSFYEPSKTFSTQKGLESALASCDKAVRNFFVGNMSIRTWPYAEQRTSPVRQAFK